MKTSFVSILTVICVLTLPACVNAQKIPQVGYVFPAGGKAGTTVDVRLGGYGWTPDMEYFVLNRGV